MLHMTKVRSTGAYRLWLEFSDGVNGEVDLAAELDGPVFEPLRDPALFAQVSVDPEINTITWPTVGSVRSTSRRHADPHTVETSSDCLPDSAPRVP